MVAESGPVPGKGAPTHVRVVGCTRGLLGTQRTGQNLWHFYIRRETCKSSAWKATKELLLSGPKEGKGGGKSSISPGDNGVQPLENRLLIPPLVKHSTGFSFSCPAILVVELRTLSILGKCSTTPPDRY